MLARRSAIGQKQTFANARDWRMLSFLNARDRLKICHSCDGPNLTYIRQDFNGALHHSRKQLHKVNVTRILQTLLFISVVAGIIAGYNRYGLWGWDIAPDWLVKASFCHHGTRQINGFKDAFLIASAVTCGVALATFVFMMAARTGARIHRRYASVIVLIPIALLTMDVCLTIRAASIVSATNMGADHSAAWTLHNAACRPLQE
jgi:hypothetical protein